MGVDFNKHYWETVSGHDQDLNRQTVAMIHDADRIIGQIAPVFRRFRDRLVRTGCVTRHDRTISCVAVFNAHASVDGFKNEMLVGPKAFVERDDKYPQVIRSRIHEGIHAIQFQNAACAHASPFNPHTRIVLAPHDYIVLMELKERVAFAMEELSGEIVGGRIDPHNHDQQEEWIQSRVLENLETVLVDDVTRISYYRDLALKEYEGMLPKRVQEYGGDITFAVLEDEDIMSVGKIFDGFGAFRNDGVLLSRLRKDDYMPSEQKRVNEIATLADIKSVLPFGEALKLRGHTRETILKQSLAKPSGPQIALEL